MLSNEKEMHQMAIDQKKYEKFQMKNLGRYEKLFPLEIPDDIEEA